MLTLTNAKCYLNTYFYDFVCLLVPEDSEIGISGRYVLLKKMETTADFFIALKVTFNSSFYLPYHGLLMSFAPKSHGETRLYEENGRYTMYFNPEIDQDVVYEVY